MSYTDSYVRAQDLIKNAEYKDHIDTQYDGNMTDGRPNRHVYQKMFQYFPLCAHWHELPKVQLISIYIINNNHTM